MQPGHSKWVSRLPAPARSALPSSLLQKSPSVDIQINPPIHIEADPFYFQQVMLQVISAAIGSGTDLSKPVDHALPGDVIADRQCSQGEPDCACCAADPSSNLAVTADMTGRDLVYQCVDSLVE
jgi:hypothetical protein